MSDSYQVSLGIGTPASIKRFILFGLTTARLAAVKAGLHERFINAATLPGRMINDGGLYDRDFAAGTLEDKP